MRKENTASGSRDSSGPADRTLTTIDRNPEILEGLLSTVDNTVDTVGGVANTTLQPGGVVDNTVGTVGGIAGSVTRR